VDVASAFVADGESAEAMKPGEGSLDDPSKAPESFSTLDALASDPWNHAAESTRQPVGFRVVRLVGVQLVRTSARTSSGHLDGRKRVEHRFEHPRIVHVRRRERDVQWDAVAVDEQVVLRAQFAPVRRVGTSRLAPPFAGTLDASSEARDQSISPRLPSSSRMTS
jgi:hypothetical protein